MGKGRKWEKVGRERVSERILCGVAICWKYIEQGEGDIKWICWKREEAVEQACCGLDEDMRERQREREREREREGRKEGRKEGGGTDGQREEREETGEL